MATLLGDHHIEDPLYLYSFLLISLHATVLHSNQSSHPHTLSLFLSLPLSPPPLSLTLPPYFFLLKAQRMTDLSHAAIASPVQPLQPMN